MSPGDHLGKDAHVTQTTAPEIPTSDLPSAEWLRRRVDAHPGRLSDTAVDLTTIIGRLWMHGDDKLMTPVVTQHGFWEPELGNLLQRTLKQDMTFVDVGANIGYFSVMAAGLVGPEGRVVSVEPEPGNLALLTANLWRNGHRNATIAPTAVYSYSGELVFVVPEISRAAGHLDPGATEGTRVPCVAVDDLLEGQRIDFMKIDAEGADLEVLRGAATVLENSPDVTVIVEVLTEYSPKEQFENFMGEGFALHLISPDGDLTPASTDEALTAASLVTYMNIALRRP